MLETYTLPLHLKEKVKQLGYTEIDRVRELRFWKTLCIISWIITAIVVYLWLFIPDAEAKEIGQASWYSVASCKQEGTSGIMANGKELKDEDYTCAIWGQKFGTIIKVTNIKTGASVQVMVTDRGPAKRLVKKGRIIDLSKSAFQKICDLEKGLCEVRIEVLK